MSITDTSKAWILTIGNEIINGVITDTNRETISRELRSVGISVIGMSSIGDDPTLIADGLQAALQRAEIVVASGGLGPTEDDKRQRLLRSSLAFRSCRPGAACSNRGAFPAVGTPHVAHQCKTGPVPGGAIPIPNDHGTAPGFMIEKDGRVALFFRESPGS